MAADPGWFFLPDRCDRGDDTQARRKADVGATAAMLIAARAALRNHS